jgi:hypothetical protein
MVYLLYMGTRSCLQYDTTIVLYKHGGILTFGFFDEDIGNICIKVLLGGSFGNALGKLENTGQDADGVFVEVSGLFQQIEQYPLSIA